MKYIYIYIFEYKTVITIGISMNRRRMLFRNIFVKTLHIDVHAIIPQGSED